MCVEEERAAVSGPEPKGVKKKGHRRTPSGTSSAAVGHQHHDGECVCTCV